MNTGLRFGAISINLPKEINRQRVEAVAKEIGQISGCDIHLLWGTAQEETKTVVFRQNPGQGKKAAEWNWPKMESWNSVLFQPKNAPSVQRHDADQQFYDFLKTLVSPEWNPFANKPKELPLNNRLNTSRQGADLRIHSVFDYIPERDWDC